MKKSIMLLALWLVAGLATIVNAQIININPDPEGEPWWVGGYKWTPELQAMYDSLPELIPTKESGMTPLPYKVDNSEKMYFIEFTDGYNKFIEKFIKL